MKPVVAIVGVPNVGKSTLFNRLIGKRRALVQDEPGVTRDRHYGDVEAEGRAFTLIDTGGFVPGDRDPLLEQVRQQAQLAVEESNVVLWVVDGRAGRTGADEELGRLLRRGGRPVVLAVNKADREVDAEGLRADFLRIGFPDVFAVSAEHSLGIGALLEQLVALLPPAEAEPAVTSEEEPAIRLAIIGRPNVGKSTLVNALLKEKRLIASEVPGTTRDAIDTELRWNGKRVVLTDTAGIRRKRSIAQRVEQFAVIAALRALEGAEVAVLVLDATELAVDQDSKLAGLVEEKGKALLIVVNKWDLGQKAGLREDNVRKDLAYQLKFVGYAPVIFTAALKGVHVDALLRRAAKLAEQYHLRASTPILNKLLGKIVDAHPAPRIDGKVLRMYYIRQVGSAPPTFALTCNRPRGVPASYRRFLVGRLREAFGLEVPVHLVFKERPGRERREARKRPSPHRK